MAERQAHSDKTDFGPAAFAAPRTERGAAAEGELHVCPQCRSELVFPIDWAPHDRRSWAVALRCPDCEWHGDGVYAQDVVDRFDEVLDDGTEQLLEDLNLLTRANMEEQIERFCAALRADQILPEDF